MGLASRWNVWRDRNQRDSRPQKKRSRTSLFRILDTFRQFRPAPTYDTRENNARLRVASIQSREKKCQTRKISLTTRCYVLTWIKYQKNLFTHPWKTMTRNSRKEGPLLALVTNPPKPRNATLVKKTLFLPLPSQVSVSFSSSPPRLSLLDRIERRIFAEARAQNRRARACTHAENRFSIRFNFTLTSAQFSLHGYWPFSSASGRHADRNEKRGRERERLIYAAVARVFSKRAFPRNAAAAASNLWCHDRSTDRSNDRRLGSGSILFARSISRNSE